MPGYIRQTLLGRMGDVSVFMKEFKQRFSRWYNRRTERFGTLWAERFKSVLVEGKGEADPIGDNATDDGRTANRRVEIMIKREETLQ